MPRSSVERFEPYYIAGILIDYERYVHDLEYRQKLGLEYENNPKFRKAMDEEFRDAKNRMDIMLHFPLYYDVENRRG